MLSSGGVVNNNIFKNAFLDQGFILCQMTPLEPPSAFLGPYPWVTIFSENPYNSSDQCIENIWGFSWKFEKMKFRSKFCRKWLIFRIFFPILVILPVILPLLTKIPVRGHPRIRKIVRHEGDKSKCKDAITCFCLN